MLIFESPVSSGQLNMVFQNDDDIVARVWVNETGLVLACLSFTLSDFVSMVSKEFWVDDIKTMMKYERDLNGFRLALLGEETYNGL
jgi:hypothetical protein